MTVTAATIDLTPILNLRMVKGVGDGKATACAMHQAAILDAVRSGRSLTKATDKLECACPILRVMLILLNDGPWWSSDDERAEMLRPLVIAILDTKSARAVEDDRAHHAAMWPMALECAAEKTADASRQEILRDFAASLRTATDSLSGRAIARHASADDADDAFRKSLRDSLITEWRALAAITEATISTLPQRA